MEETKKSVSHFTAIVIVQSVLIAVLILGVVAVKYIRPTAVKKISGFFEDKMCEKTDADDVKRYFKDAV